MIVDSNSSKLLQSFREFQKVLERKLNHVVREFSYIITEEAIAKTPLGNAEEFMDRYIARQQAIGINPQEGYARGSWQVQPSQSFTLQTIYGANSGVQALSVVKSQLSGITFKDDIYIGNRGYYIGLLQDNYSSQTEHLGIMKPTLEAVMQVYKISIKSIYDKG